MITCRLGGFALDSIKPGFVNLLCYLLQVSRSPGTTVVPATDDFHQLFLERKPRDLSRSTVLTFPLPETSSSQLTRRYLSFAWMRCYSHAKQPFVIPRQTPAPSPEPRVRACRSEDAMLTWLLGPLVPINLNRGCLLPSELQVLNLTFILYAQAGVDRPLQRETRRVSE